VKEPNPFKKEKKKKGRKKKENYISFSDP